MGSGPSESGGVVTTFQYFAYGSNMLTERLRARCHSARPIGVGVTSGYGVGFQKRGTDNSAKATLIARPESHVYGVIFEVASSERGQLDAAEGAGYTAIDDFPVWLIPPRGHAAGEHVARRATTTYEVESSWRTTELQPYHWYKALVVHGAIEHGLPDEHINRLQAVRSVADPWEERPGLLAARAALGALNVNTWPVVGGSE